MVTSQAHTSKEDETVRLAWDQWSLERADRGGGETTGPSGNATSKEARTFKNVPRDRGTDTGQEELVEPRERRNIPERHQYQSSRGALQRTTCLEFYTHTSLLTTCRSYPGGVARGKGRAQ